MRILVFSPFSGIWEFASLEGRVAAALAEAGHEVVFVTCGGLFRRHCLVMAAQRLPADADAARRAAVCEDCRSRADALRRRQRLSGGDVIDMVDPEVREDAARAVDGVDLDTALALRVDGFPVGRRALYPFLALKKKDSLDLSGAELAEYRDQLYNTILAVRATGALLDQYRPDAVLTYSSTYSIVAACLEVARARGVKDYFIEASGGMGSRQFRAILARSSIVSWYAALRSAWTRVAELPAAPGDMQLVTEHMLHLFGARSVFVYSASARPGAFDVRAAVGAGPEQRILLATMSSYDEWFAAEEAGIMPKHASAFSTQIEWVSTLFEMLRRRSDLFVVLRVHPREFPNQRDSAYSAHALRLLEVLKSTPANCFVNWPDQKLSLYDLAKGVDVVLNAWSSAGKELGLLGLPVVEWAPDVLLYPPDSRYVAQRADEYEACIDRALADGWQAGQVRRMYRWCALEYGAASFRTDLPTPPDAATVRFVRRLARAIHRRISPVSAACVTLRRPIDPAEANRLSAAIETGEGTLADGKARMVGEDCGAAHAAEEAALRGEAGRLVMALFGAMEGPGGGIKAGLAALAAGQPRASDQHLESEVRRMA